VSECTPVLEYNVVQTSSMPEYIVVIEYIVVLDGLLHSSTDSSNSYIHTGVMVLEYLISDFLIIRLIIR
jgi:hypothetical protein